MNSWSLVVGRSLVFNIGWWLKAVRGEVTDGHVWGNTVAIFSHHCRFSRVEVIIDVFCKAGERALVVQGPLY